MLQCCVVMIDTLVRGTVCGDVGFSDSSLVGLTLDAARGLLYYTDKVQGIIAEITTAGVRKRKLFSDRSRHPRAIAVDSYNG